MAVAIKLIRIGKKARPFYHLVVSNKRAKRGGVYLEKIGSYNPLTNPATINVDKKRFDYWQSRGAQIAKGVKKLMAKIRKTTKKGGD